MNSIDYLTERFKDYNNKISQNEIEKLIYEYQNGNVKAGGDLIKGIFAWIIFVTTKVISYTNFEIDDCLSIAILGAYRAAKNYDLSREDAKFITYAKKCMFNHIITYAQKEYTGKFNSHRMCKELKFVELSDNIGDNINIENQDFVLAKSLIKEIEKLNEKERIAIKMHYGLDDGIEKKMDDISPYLGNVSRQRVDQILKQARNKLKVRLRKIRKELTL